jgi:hypothetical protein
MPRRADLGPMADQRHPRQASRSNQDQDKRDRELDAWMDRAIGSRKPDPQPVVRDL